MAEVKTLYASAARTATPTEVEFQNAGDARGMHVIIDVTAVTATPSVVFNIEAKDPASGDWYLLLDSTAVTAVSTTILKIHPNLTAVANSVAQDGLPLDLRVRPVHADADSITYTVGANMID